MINCLIGIILINTILCYTRIPGVFDNKTVLTGYITPENNLLIFSRNNSGKIELQKYEMDSDSILYNNYTKLELEPFPINDSEIITDFHFSFEYINYTAINYIIFNEKYLSSYIYKANSNYYSFISMEEIGPNKLAIFHKSKNVSLYNNTISIASFDYKNGKFNYSKIYSFDILKERANINCVITSNNNIVCGAIEYAGYSYFGSSFNYSLFLLQEESQIEPIYVNKNIGKDEYTINGVYKNNFFKLIPLEEDKIIYCHYYFHFYSVFGEGISCGLAQIIDNSNLTIIIKSEEIFNKMAEPNYLRKNLFSGIKFNNNEVILSYVEFNSYDSRYIAKLTISKNNTFIKNIQYLPYDYYSRSNLHNYIQLLKNKDNDLIFLIVYKNMAEFDELSYAYCGNKDTTIYNGDKSFLKFSFDPGLYKGHNNDIVFINNKKDYYSLFYGNEKEPIKNGTIYNKNSILFYLNLKDYDDIKKNGVYNITFRNTLNPKESEVCTLTLKFYECDEECDICTSEKCYDKYWNLIDREKIKANKFFITVSVLIFITIFVFVFLILFAFIRGLKRDNNSNINYINNNLQSENIHLIN